MNIFRRLFLLNKFVNNVPKFLTSESSAKAFIENAENEKSIIVNKTGKITLIAINRPEKKNALDTATTKLLCDALDEFEKDDNAAVGVLYGIGGNFCAGFDLHEIANSEGNENKLPQFGALASRNELTSKPLVASLNGYAAGFGLELALMCDVRVIEETAVIGFLNRRFGIPILCGGKSITGEEAFNIGLATKLTTCGTGLGQAVNYAKSLVKFPQQTLLADRTSMHYATFLAKQMEEALQFEKDNASHLLIEEGIEGAKKFAEKGIGRHGKFYNLTEQDDTIRELDKNLL
ncbi:PREDICTED: 2,3-dehydroadipyl-CoA hydratase-like isoform X2 [Polistes canadensis]|uniref:2,3-dehydroadipyl-CoA hydratase-like isoform X2 n=1 Tax=Polistes canadensis TaxID=91411 RepID=UPI000718B720|nr:PREDICTED: 2,3-dehydroadipyl-CoA hydratase-like isoform X2 [Polistes canadensis]